MSITNGIVSSKIYDKRDDFNFEIVNFPFLDGDVPRSPSSQFKKIVKRYIRVVYNLNIMRQSACLVLNPITVYSYGFLFNCTTVGQASDSMTALT